MAITDNASSKLLDLSAITQTQYHNVYLEQVFRKGRTINRIISDVTGDEIINVDSTGITFQLNRGFGDTARFTTAVHDEFPTPRAFDPTTLQARFSESSGSANDFSVVQTAASITDIQLATGGDGAIIDAGKRIVREMSEGYGEALAKHRSIDRTGQLALINGTPKQNNTYRYSSAASTPTNATGARFPIDNGSIGLFSPGMHLDFYSSAGVLQAGNVVVTDVNTAADELSIGVSYTTSGADASTGTGLASGGIGDNSVIYMSGERNKGMYSVPAWFSRPASSGDSFIGATDRNASANRWLIMTSTRESNSAAVIDRTHFDDAATAVAYKLDTDLDVICYTDLTISNTLRQNLDKIGMATIPISDAGSGRFYNFGGMGVQFQHPMWGTVKILADNLATPNTCRMMVAQDWRMLQYGWKGLRVLDGDNGSGWYRKNQDTVGSGRGKVYLQNAYALVLDYCLVPSRQVTIANVTA